LLEGSCSEVDALYEQKKALVFDGGFLFVVMSLYCCASEFAVRVFGVKNGSYNPH
jgi:hypothetical protein